MFIVDYIVWTNFYASLLRRKHVFDIIWEASISCYDVFEKYLKSCWKNFSAFIEEHLLLFVAIYKEYLGVLSKIKFLTLLTLSNQYQFANNQTEPQLISEQQPRITLEFFKRNTYYLHFFRNLQTLKRLEHIIINFFASRTFINSSPFQQQFQFPFYLFIYRN